MSLSSNPTRTDAATRLANHLRHAWVGAGCPALTDVADQVGYSTATVSRVLAGTMTPDWHLIRKLGPVFRVAESTIMDVWHPLWAQAGSGGGTRRPWGEMRNSPGPRF